MLEVENLFVGYYKDLNILQGVSLKASEGLITTVLGPNGVGKSTLLKAIFGFIKPSTGEIRWNGQSLRRLAPSDMIRIGISYMPQRQSIFPEMSVQENIELGAWTFRNQTNLIQKKIRKNYERFPILYDRRQSRAGELSGGMQRMVEISRILMTDPKLILIDEPTASLALMMTREIYELIKQLKDEGITILLVDQNIRQAVKIADYIYVLELGRNRLDGPREEFSDLKKTLWL